MRWGPVLTPSQKVSAAACAGMKPQGGETIVKFLLWCILLVLCWPLALMALVLYPLVWLLLLPFRVVGIAVGGVLDLVKAIILSRRGCCGDLNRLNSLSFLLLTAGVKFGPEFTGKSRQARSYQS